MSSKHEVPREAETTGERGGGGREASRTLIAISRNNAGINIREEERFRVMRSTFFLMGRTKLL